MAAANNDIDQIYQKCYEGLKVSLLKKEKNQSLVEDILQDSFIKLLLNLRNGANIIHPKSWLYRVSQNLLIDHYRQKEKTKQDCPDLNPTSTKPYHGPEDCLLGLIAHLPSKYKQAVFLTDIKGIPQVTSAQNLGISLPTFKSRVQRGRKLVAQGYVDCCDYKMNESGHLEGESKDWHECKVCSHTMPNQV